MIAFTELALAAYCPRKLYYRRQNDEFERAAQPGFELAFRYPSLLDAATDLTEEPIAVSPSCFRENLRSARRRVDRFDELCSPTRRSVYLAGTDAHGVAHKLLANPPAPSIVSVGTPPSTGVWEPHAVRAVGAAKALAYEREMRIETAYVEYATHGVIREFEITGRRRAQYRRAVRTVETLGDPPPRLQQRTKCNSCEYRESCGVRTESLFTRLFG
ncbi:CRISPR-associated protein Cas4 [Halocatena halophila]|uniref:CRISPR-associated protein Cas4 n=1 Tax=Halocatena halophila TaxID=2814576 RepID=UPI002ED5B317